MINIGKYEWENNIKVTLNNGQVFFGNGNGISLAEDFDFEEDQYDTFFIQTKDANVALKIDDIVSVEKIKRSK